MRVATLVWCCQCKESLSVGQWPQVSPSAATSCDDPELSILVVIWFVTITWNKGMHHYFNVSLSSRSTCEITGLHNTFPELVTIHQNRIPLTYCNDSFCYFPSWLIKTLLNSLLSCVSWQAVWGSESSGKAALFVPHYLGNHGGSEMLLSLLK